MCEHVTRQISSRARIGLPIRATAARTATSVFTAGRTYTHVLVRRASTRTNYDNDDSGIEHRDNDR